MTTGVDNAFSGISNQRANQVSDDVYGDTQEDAQGRLINYLNRAAFAVAGAGHRRHQPAERLVGPELLEWHQPRAAAADFAHGTQNIELRIEAFNLLNTFSWGIPDDEPRVRTVRPHHRTAGRPAHHAVRGQVRFLDGVSYVVVSAFRSDVVRFAGHYEWQELT